MTLTYLPRSVELTGCRVKRMGRAAFHVNGTTLILLPDTGGEPPVVWRQAPAGGKRSCLRRAVPGAPRVRSIPNVLIKE